jgi:O-6-methylguanine DNA methyltransferase
MKSRGEKKEKISLGQEEKRTLVNLVSDYIKENSLGNISLKVLEDRFQVNRFIIQRALMDILGISPRKYSEECRIIRLKDNIKNGEPVTRAIYNSGYKSQNWLYESMGKKAPTFREEMNCGKISNSYNIARSVPTGSGELTPDKPHKSGVRWNKTIGINDIGTVDEAGTSDTLGRRGCQRNSTSKLGITPFEYGKDGMGIRIEYMISESRLGFILVAETNKGICSVSMADMPEQLAKQLTSEFPKATLIESDQVRDSMNAILHYLNGKKLNLPVDVHGTEFQKRVWAAISRIPFGETRSYNKIAEEIGMPNAYRAVANACGANPVPLIVPCHRVIRKDGGLGGYGMGIERKKYLLEMENSVVKNSR